MLSNSEITSRSWLETHPSARWPEPDENELNPFIKWRKLLWSWHRAIEKGWSDEDFVGVVTEINKEIEEIDGSGFRITPSGTWDDVSEFLPEFCLWKNDTVNVGGSHKARHLMGLLLHLAVDAVDSDRRLAISSCGNAALGAATVASAVNRSIDVFIPTWANPDIVKKLENLGATIHVCERKTGEDGDPCMNRFQEAVQLGSVPFSVQAAENIMALDGGRSIGWELAEQISTIEIDSLFVQVGGGALLTSCAIGLLEAQKFGVLDKVPRISAVQTEGCAPFDRAWGGLAQLVKAGEKVEYAIANSETLMTSWEKPASLATGILDDITYDWVGVVNALAKTGGGSIVASETEIVAAYKLVNSLGVAVEPTGSASVAGVINALKSGYINGSDRVGVLLTGIEHSIKAGERVTE